MREWLAPFDPGPLYDRSISLYLEGTGSWFLEGLFKPWLEGKSPPILWLSAKRTSARIACLLFVNPAYLPAISWHWQNDATVRLDNERPDPANVSICEALPLLGVHTPCPRIMISINIWRCSTARSRIKIPKTYAPSSPRSSISSVTHVLHSGMISMSNTSFPNISCGIQRAK